MTPALVPPDPRPGFYYVSVLNNLGDARLILGPFGQHDQALSHVADARKMSEAMDHRAFWYAFGTCRTEENAGPGILNRWEAGK